MNDDRSKASALACYALALHYRIPLEAFEIDNMIELAQHFGVAPTEQMKKTFQSSEQTRIVQDQYVADLERRIKDLERPFLKRLANKLFRF